MNFNKFLKAMFGDKSSRDMKLIQPLVDKVKEAYPEIKKLSNDELRAKTKEIQKYVQDAAVPYQEKIAELKAQIEETPIDEREPIFDEIDKQDKDMLEALEKALNEIMPTAYSIIKDTARRFSENEETIVTATEFDKQLAADPKNDFITIIHGLPEVIWLNGTWFTTMFRYSEALLSIRERLQRWQLVKEKPSLQHCQYS